MTHSRTHTPAPPPPPDPALAAAVAAAGAVTPSDPAPPVRHVPAWAAAMAVVGCLAAGGALVWWLAREPGAGGQVIVLDRAPTDGVRRTGPGAWRIDAGNVSVRLRRPPAGGGPVAVEFAVDKYDFLEPAQVAVLTKVWQITRDPSWGGILRLTPAQRQALKEIREGAKVRLESADVRPFQELFPAYEPTAAPALKARDALAAAEAAERAAENAGPPAAPRPGAAKPAAGAGRGEGEVSEALAAARAATAAARDEYDRLESVRRRSEAPLVRAAEQLAARLLPSVKESAARRAALAQSTLTPEQWQRYENGGQEP